MDRNNGGDNQWKGYGFSVVEEVGKGQDYHKTGSRRVVGEWEAKLQAVGKGQGVLGLLVKDI